MPENSEVLKEARRLYALGFAVHWLRPRSKIPLEPGWTTGPRKTWKELVKTYRAGLNVGVRLGPPSEVEGGYLAVIDVDVKSKEKRHRIEALTAAQNVLSGKSCPVVRSGRGNGSRHYYVITENPFKTFNAAISSEKVRVFMPSKTPSQEELRTLSLAEIEKGTRIANAWEVSLYSEGRQVVVPPSVHPDSGEAYRWTREIGNGTALPKLDISRTVSETPTKGEVLEDFKVESVDLGWLPIPQELRKAIVEGDGVTDRSAFLLKAASALRSADLSVNEVLTVLTDPENFISSCAYEHAKTQSRKRAADWVYKYTLGKVEKEKEEHKESVDVFRNIPIPPKCEGDSEAETNNDGFYYRGSKGNLIPQYDLLLAEFEKEKPYKSIADMKAVYVFNGTHYENFTPTEIKGFAEDHFYPKPCDKIRNEFLNKVLVNNIVLREFFVSTTEGKINFKNGVLDLNNGTELKPHHKGFGFRGVLPYDFDPEAVCPFFEKWLKEVLLDDHELFAVVQEFMGYIVRGGEYRYHKALWLQGEGRNGKSTFIDIIKSLIGSGNYSTISIKTLVGDKFAGAELDGKIANFSEETTPKELQDSGPFKNLTGDGDFFAQKKYGDPYSFRNRAKLIMSYNQVPDLSDLSAGMLSRPIIIPFKKEIKESEQDHSIKEKLCAELPGIFNFSLRGWDRLQRQNHFTVSDQSKEALTSIREESCSAMQWILNYVDFTEEGKNGPQTFPSQMYASYREKERYPYRIPEFFRRINKHPKIKERKTHDREKRFYWGIKIR